MILRLQYNASTGSELTSSVAHGRQCLYTLRQRMRNDRANLVSIVSAVSLWNDPDRTK
jgi:hypothetical protein